MDDQNSFVHLLHKSKMKVIFADSEVALAAVHPSLLKLHLVTTEYLTRSESDCQDVRVFTDSPDRLLHGNLRKQCVSDQFLSKNNKEISADPCGSRKSGGKDVGKRKIKKIKGKILKRTVESSKCNKPEKISRNLRKCCRVKRKRSPVSWFAPKDIQIMSDIDSKQNFAERHQDPNGRSAAISDRQKSDYIVRWMQHPEYEERLALSSELYNEGTGGDFSRMMLKKSADDHHYVTGNKKELDVAKGDTTLTSANSAKKSRKTESIGTKPKTTYQLQEVATDAATTTYYSACEKLDHSDSNTSSDTTLTCSSYRTVQVYTKQTKRQLDSIIHGMKGTLLEQKLNRMSEIWRMSLNEGPMCISLQPIEGLGDGSSQNACMVGFESSKLATSMSQIKDPAKSTRSENVKAADRSELTTGLSDLKSLLNEEMTGMSLDVTTSCLTVTKDDTIASRSPCNGEISQNPDEETYDSLMDRLKKDAEFVESYRRILDRFSFHLREGICHSPSFSQNDSLVNLITSPEAMQTAFHWIHIMDIDLKVQDILEIEYLAVILEIKELDEICSNFIRQLKSPDVDLQLYRGLMRTKQTKSIQRALELLSHHFQEIVWSPTFTKDFTVDELCQLISLEEISASREMDILMVAVLWMTAEWPSRKAEINKVMNHVRFDHLTTLDIQVLLDYNGLERNGLRDIYNEVIKDESVQEHLLQALIRKASRWEQGLWKTLSSPPLRHFRFKQKAFEENIDIFTRLLKPEVRITKTVNIRQPTFELNENFNGFGSNDHCRLQ